MTRDEVKKELEGSFPEDDLDRIIDEVRWTLLGTTIKEALDAGRDDAVRSTLQAYNDGAYI